MRLSVLVRYSTVSKGLAQTFQRGREVSFDEYLNAIFAPERLAARESLFSGLTLPSIANQTLKPDRSWFRLHILTSDALPAENRANLDRIIAPYDWAHIHSGPVEGPGGRHHQHWVSEFLKETAQRPRPTWAETIFGRQPQREPFPFMTMRLDDDDGLSEDFFERLRPYCTADHEGHVISFGQGYCALYDPDSERFTDFAKILSPNIGLGLSCVSMFDPQSGKITSKVKDIFEAGTHHHVANKAIVITDNIKPSYIRTIAPNQDSAEQSIKQFQASNRVTPDEVASHVRFEKLKLVG